MEERNPVQVIPPENATALEADIFKEVLAFKMANHHHKYSPLWLFWWTFLCDRFFPHKSLRHLIFVCLNNDFGMNKVEDKSNFTGQTSNWGLAKEETHKYFHKCCISTHLNIWALHQHTEVVFFSHTHTYKRTHTVLIKARLCTLCPSRAAIFSRGAGAEMECFRQVRLSGRVRQFGPLLHTLRQLLVFVMWPFGRDNLQGLNERLWPPESKRDLIMKNKIHCRVRASALWDLKHSGNTVGGRGHF